MKISILKESLNIGGTERSVSNISVALSKKHTVKNVLYSGNNMIYPYGGELYDMQLPPQKSKIKKIINNLKRAKSYNEHIKDFEPDIAFQFVSFRSPISRIKLKKCIKIVSSRDYSALSENISAYKKMLDSSDAIVCNSSLLRDYFVKKYPEDKNRVFAVYNIIDADSIRKQAEDETDSDFLEFRRKNRKLIVSTGRFCKEKAFENLIRAFSQVHKKNPETGLVLIGDGEYKDKYLKIIEELGISDYVCFTGFQKNPYKYMAKCDLFVLSSASEGFPNVLAEAMALSLPVVSVNCLTGPAEILMKSYDYEIVKDSFAECDYGILTPHYSVKGEKFAVDEMTNAIVYLLENDELMRKYGTLSRQRVTDFRADVAVEKLENIFDSLVARRQNR